MINPLPWKLDEHNPSIIYSAEGDVIAKDYTFLNVDDFEGICDMVNSSTARRMIISARSVTINPKNIENKDSLEHQYYLCPGCGGDLIETDHSFCPDCGIKIKWGDDKT